MKGTLRRFLPLIFILLFVAQCFWFVGTQSVCGDETVNTLIGFSALRDGNFRHWGHNPSLSRMLVVLPVVGKQWQMVQGRHEWDILQITPDPEAFAWRVRTVSVVFGVALASLVWFAARSFFSSGAATFALGLFAFSPVLLTQFSLANVDGPSALAVFALAYQVVRFVRQPSRRQAVLLGLALGCCLSTKGSAPPMAVLALLLCSFSTLKGFSLSAPKETWSKLLLACAIAALVVWGSYFFHISRLELENGRARITFPNTFEEFNREIPFKGSLTLYIPAAEYIFGLRDLMIWNRQGFPAFMLGEYYHGGRVAYFPTVILLKWQPIVLCLFAAGVVLYLSKRLRLHFDYVVMMAFPLVYFLFALTASLNMGDRHLVPIYPFLLLVAAGVWEASRNIRWAQLVLVVLLPLHAVDVLRYAPDYMSYFNPLVRPETSFMLLSGPSLDLGQGLLALRKYEAQHPNETMHLAYWGPVRPQAYGIRSGVFGPQERPIGTVIVSATLLTGYREPYYQAYQWVLRCPRKTVLNHSLHVFEVSPACVAQ